MTSAEREILLSITIHLSPSNTSLYAQQSCLFFCSSPRHFFFLFFCFAVLIYAFLLRHHNVSFMTMCHINKYSFTICLCLFHKSYISHHHQNICSNLYSSLLMRISINYHVEWAADSHSWCGVGFSREKATENHQIQICFFIFHSTFFHASLLFTHCFLHQFSRFLTRFFLFCFIRSTEIKSEGKTCAL